MEIEAVDDAAPLAALLERQPWVQAVECAARGAADRGAPGLGP